MSSFFKETFIVILLILLMWSEEAYAGSTSTNGVAARAQSMQNAFTAVADDPSAIFYNPAGLTQVDGSELLVGVSMMFIDMDYTNSESGISSSSTEKVFPASLFLSTNIIKAISLGFGIYSPFARKSNYSPNMAVGNMNHSSELLRLDFVPTVAIDIGQYVSVGLGFVGSIIDLESDVLGFLETGDGYGYTGQGGILIKPHDRFKVGLNYRGPMNADIEGSGTLIGVGRDDFSATIKFPAVLSLGFAWDYSEFFLVALSVDWEMWSHINEIRRKYTNPAHQMAGLTILNSEDSYNIRFGMIFKPQDFSEIRAGYSYLTAAVPADSIIPAQPDYDGHAFSIGYSRSFDYLRVDLGYEFDYIPTRSSNSFLFPGDYENKVHSIQIGVSFKFGNLART
ncbi:MAG: outer membrane protein transport protein [Nitrospirota bacterium]|nr:outer membrane protein transport protein [Nitrospirota bacterium]